MQPIEKYLEHADRLAQEVVNAWGINVGAGNTALLTEEFNALLDKACRYQNAKSYSDNHREFRVLSQRDISEEETTRREFAAAYKLFWERQPAANFPVRT
jgi:hypothetical protein